jgi:hypothetical protein
MSDVKYPRTFHLPWSPGATKDDRILSNTDHFNNKLVSVSFKMDGECSTLTREKVYARSVDSIDHPSRHWLKSLHAGIKYNIQPGWRICGENLFAVHSIKYHNLASYFMVFSVWDDRNYALSLESTLDFCASLYLHYVPIIWEDYWAGDMERKLNEVFKRCENQEGYVVRVKDSFHYDDFGYSVAKFVRKNHVKTDKHWMFGKVERNGLKHS